MNHAHHLRFLFDATRRNITIDLVLKEIEAQKYEFNTIAVRGTSGLLVGAIVAHILGKELCIIRKRDEGSHSWLKVEGPNHITPKFLIIDDCVDSGETVVHILSAMKSAAADAKCVGAIMYNRLVDKESSLGQKVYSPAGLKTLLEEFELANPNYFKEIVRRYRS